MSIQAYIINAKAALEIKEADERAELARRNAEIAARNKAKLDGLLDAYPAEVRPYGSLFHITHHGCMVKFSLPGCAEFLYAYDDFSDKGIAILPDEEDDILSWARRQRMTFEVAVAYAARQGEVQS